MSNLKQPRRPISLSEPRPGDVMRVIWERAALSPRLRERPQKLRSAIAKRYMRGAEVISVW